VSAGRLLTRVERLAGRLTPQGQIVVLPQYRCQSDGVLDALAVQALAGFSGLATCSSSWNGRRPALEALIPMRTRRSASTHGTTSGCGSHAWDVRLAIAPPSRPTIIENGTDPGNFDVV
jgi:hypothetical protein